MRKTLWRRAAGAVLGLEAVALAVVLCIQVTALVSGDTAALDSAIALAVLSVIAGLAIAAFAVAAWRGRSWGRSGGIVVQIMIVSVAVGAATGASAHPLVAVAIAFPAVVGFVLLILAVREAGAADAAVERGTD